MREHTTCIILQVNIFICHYVRCLRRKQSTSSPLTVQLWPTSIVWIYRIENLWPKCMFSHSMEWTSICSTRLYFLYMFAKRGAFLFVPCCNIYQDYLYVIRSWWMGSLCSWRKESIDYRYSQRYVIYSVNESHISIVFYCVLITLGLQSVGVAHYWFMQCVHLYKFMIECNLLLDDMFRSRV